MNVKDIVFKILGKDTEIDEKKQEVITKYSTKVKTIVFIFKNLGLLDKNDIIKKINNEDEKKIANDLLNKYNFSFNKSEKDFLSKYYNPDDLGYGDNFLNKLVNKLNSIISSNYNMSEEEIDHLIIEKSKIYLEDYKSYLSDVARTLKYDIDLGMDANIDVPKIAKFLLANMKSEKLGYPYDFESKINKMVNNLENLEYGGYKGKKIQEFRKLCNDKINEGKLNNLNNKEILDYIRGNIYKLYLNQYKMDLSSLKENINILNNNQSISIKDKEYKEQELILDFNIHNGMEINPDKSVDDLAIKLENDLNVKDSDKNIYSKYIDKFRDGAKDILDLSIADKDKTIRIRLLYNDYKNNYLLLKKELQKHLDLVESSSLPEYMKEKQVKALNSYFEREIISDDSVDERLNYMFSSLNDLNWSKRDIESFKNNVLNKLPTFSSSEEAFDFLNREYVNLITDTSDKIDTYIEILGMRLATLPGGGYGEEAIAEFKEFVQEKIANVTDFDTKKMILSEIYGSYKEKYDGRLVILSEWKKDRLREYEEDDKEKYKEKLNSDVKKMLSLSPRAFTEYIKEDNNIKKQQLEEYNLKIILKYLAKEELKKTSDEKLYKDRLDAIDKGEIPYNDDDIDEARDKISRAVFDDDSDFSLMTVEDFIDNTLFSQLTEASQSASKNRKL